MAEKKEFFPTFGKWFREFLGFFRANKKELPAADVLGIGRNASYRSRKHGIRTGKIVHISESGRARIDLGEGHFVRRKLHLLTTA